MDHLHDGREFKTKEAVRDFVWRLLEEASAGRFQFPIRGRIPNFAGSRKAVGHLLELRAFREARPDHNFDNIVWPIDPQPII